MKIYMSKTVSRTMQYKYKTKIYILFRKKFVSKNACYTNFLKITFVLQ